MLPVGKCIRVPTVYVKRDDYCKVSKNEKSFIKLNNSFLNIINNREIDLSVIIIISQFCNKFMVCFSN